jgi:hypothetical protein
LRVLQKPFHAHELLQAVGEVTGPSQDIPRQDIPSQDILS